MRLIVAALAAMSLAMSVSACGEMGADESEADDIVGDWKMDPASLEVESPPWRLRLADGEFNCASCVPPFTIPADGEWHAVEATGFDGQKIEVVDENTLRGARRRGDKDIGNAIWNVSEDGQSLELAWTDTSGFEPVSGTTNLTRLEEGPEGSHLVSGAWNLGDVGLDEPTEEGGILTFAMDGNTLTASHDQGGYSAELGGEPVTPIGDESGGLLAVEKTGDNTYRETYTVDGEEINVIDITVEGDTLKYVSTFKPDGTVTRWTSVRQ